MFVSGKVLRRCFEAGGHDITDFSFSKKDILHKSCQYLIWIIVNILGTAIF